MNDLNKMMEITEIHHYSVYWYFPQEYKHDPGVGSLYISTGDPGEDIAALSRGGFEKSD